jgi:rhamnosyltransferase
MAESWNSLNAIGNMGRTTLTATTRTKHMPCEKVPPTPETTCAVIVTYFPDTDFFDRVERAAREVAQVVVVDNGSSDFCVKQLRETACTTNAHLILNSSNLGIARGLNIGAQWALEQGYAWLLTLDQDTKILPGMIHVHEGAFRRDPFPERLAVIGSSYTNKFGTKLGTKEIVGFDELAGRSTTSVLTSGSLVSLTVFQTIGGFREDFFIDCVDHEYCLRARARGFHIKMTHKPVMEHEIGHIGEHRLLWRKVATSNHPPSRQYFKARNSLILAREYIRTDAGWIFWYLLLWVKSVVLVCLFEKQRLPKMKSIIRGCLDGLLGRTSVLG